MSLSTLQRSRSQRPKPGSPATDNASPAPTRRAERRQAISRACLEALEGRRLMSFTPAAESYPGVTNPGLVAAADFNNDGLVDLATVTTNPEDFAINVLLGNGDGTLRQPAQTTPMGVGPSDWLGPYPLSVVAGDFNADGNIDVAASIGDYYGMVHDNVRVLLGNGDGTFGAAASASFIQGSASSFVATGDVDADGKLDLVVTTDSSPYAFSSSAGVMVLLGRGDGTFAHTGGQSVRSDYQFADYQLSLYPPVLGDFNGDGNADVAVPGGDYRQAFVKVLLGNGDGTLQPPSTAVTYPSWGYRSALQWVAAGDFNGDGRSDLSTERGIWLANGDGTFENTGAGAIGHAVDLNADGRLDLVAGGAVFLGYGDGKFAGVSTPATAGGVLALADFNADGRTDAVAYNGETFEVSVALNDGDWPPLPLAVSVSDATVTEGNTGLVNATFTVTLSHASDVDVTVRYATADISATAGGDYTAGSGTVTIPAGQTSRTFMVAVVGDRLGEPGEMFAVNLTAPTNATIRDGQGIGTILDDEPRIVITDVGKSEGHGKNNTFTFKVSLSGAYDRAVTVNYATAAGTAAAGTDFQSKSGSLTFAPGETAKTITVTVNGDRQAESNETFFVNLLGASGNAVILDRQGVGTIFDDDRR